MGNACRTTLVKRKLRFESGLPRRSIAMNGVMSCNHLVPAGMNSANAGGTTSFGSIRPFRQNLVAETV